MIQDFRDIIARRRDGKTQNAEEFTTLARSAANGTVPDYQLAAWLMATYLKPLSSEEIKDLTLAMADSGLRLDLASLPRPHLDKHSTGGVGDKTSIILMPVLAACGLTLVKMSGAGLGLTGGTTDKLSSIPGMRMDLAPSEMIAQAKKIGLALTGQSHDLAPADKVLYALRDATATTESMGLIVASILSKKIAGGAEIVVLDVKCGSGGFMKNISEAKQLKSLLEDVGSRCGLKVVAEVTDMNQPLGANVGNALEVAEAIRILSNQPLSQESERPRRLCVQLAANALVVAGLVSNLSVAKEKVEFALTSGAAQEKATEWIAAQGGPVGLDEVLLRLPRAAFQIPVFAPRSGFVHRLDAGAVGEIVVDLGGGRKKKGDKVNPAVGLELQTFVSKAAKAGEPIAIIHAASKDSGEEMALRFQDAITIKSEELAPSELILSDLER